MNNDDRDNKSGLSPSEIQEVRKRLRSLDGKQDSLLSRIGAIVSYPKSPTGNVKRYRFGVSLFLLAIFLMLFVRVLPDDDRRLYFIGFACVMVAVAAWQVDLAKKR